MGVNEFWMASAIEAGVAEEGTDPDTFEFRDSDQEAWMKGEIGKVEQFQGDLVNRNADIRALREQNLRVLRGQGIV